MTETDIAQPRRRNRVVEDREWIEGFLERAPNCVIATLADGRPFVNPNTFLYDRAEHVLFFHTAGEGRTRANIENDGGVTISVFEMGRLLPGKVVTDFTVEYASVTVFGNARIVTDPVRVRHVFDMQMAKYFPHLRPDVDYENFTDEEAAKATVYEMTIERWSAKRNQSTPEHAGAVWYPWSFFGSKSSR